MRAPAHYITPAEASVRLHAALLQALPHAAAVLARDLTVLECNRSFAEWARTRTGDGAGPLLRRLALELPWPIPSSFAGEGYDEESRQWYSISLREIESEVPRWLLWMENASARRIAIAERAAQQERLANTSRLMSVGEMATTLAHELNQPLAGISNCLAVAEVLAERVGADSSRLQQALTLARRQAEHASAVLAHVREFVRAREPRLTDVAPDELVHKAVELLAFEAERHRARIVTRIAPRLPAVHADPVMIGQVLLNLGRNALEAMADIAPVERVLEIEARRDLEGAVEVRVRDRGPGVPPERERELFRAFVSSKPDGLGVGLSICRSILEYHQGRLFYIAHPERGAVFGFTLPAATS
jgi:C4-dicarboxylate-specific signal transduction histidine kinase